ncbi:MAG: 16S rRNA (uracil(1498)-N(3))-methyltransferase [Desulfobacteraceae bacterium]|nr:16S rRNA (uracil(1498)-N(3))-methyltransferase [Desulfobacteraceae bacterium]
MHRFYITTEAISGNEATITGQDAKHLATVLRLKPGDRVELVDGKGTKATAELQSVTPGLASLSIVDKSEAESESPVHITIAQGMLKDKKMDMLIRHLTELGICEWQPFFSSRSIPKPDAKRLKSRMERWNRISREALKQCGRSMVPVIGEPLRFTDLLARATEFDERIAFWENATAPIGGIQHQDRPAVKRIIVLIGPEGGFSKDEIEEAKKNGFNSFSLGPRILRAETASITSAALVQHLFGDLGKNNP